VGGTRCGQKPGDLFDGSDTFFTPAPPVFAPGTKYLYWDDSMRQFINTLTYIAGEPIKAFFKRRVADPIGMKDWDWRKQYEVDGRTIHGQIEITAPDLARFGLLFLNKGTWEGKQLVSADWVEQATRAQVPASLPLHPVTCRKPDGRGVYGFKR
jgi:CubicO group peptidase (beta-lactamase class C family)